MVEIFGQAAISEIILLFVLVFIIPLLAFLLYRLRGYERQFGALASGRGKKKKKRESEAKAARPEKPAALPDIYPYKTKIFLTPPERACLEALSVAFGTEVKIYVKVALWELAESTDKNPGFHDRLIDKRVDFLICDAATDKPFTAVCFEPGKGVPRGPRD